MLQRTTKRNTKWSLLSPHATRAHAWSISSIGRVGLKLIRPGSLFPTWGTPAVLFGTSTLLILPCHIAFGVFPLLISFSFSTMLGYRLLSLRLHRLITWKSILRRGAVLHTLCLPWYSFHTSLCHFPPDHVCRAVQARLCCKHCRHVISLGPYLLSMMSSPFALVAVPGFSSFHFHFEPSISAPFAIRRCLPLTHSSFTIGCHP